MKLFSRAKAVSYELLAFPVPLHVSSFENIDFHFICLSLEGIPETPITPLRAQETASKGCGFVTSMSAECRSPFHIQNLGEISVSG